MRFSSFRWGIAMLVLCVLSAAGDEPDSKPSNLKAEPPDTKLTLAVAPQRGSEFVVEGRLSLPIAVPDINDFRLELVDNGDVRWVPLLFGDRRSMTWPDSARCDRLLLNLRPLRSNNGEKDVAADKDADREDSTVRLYADAALQHDAEYRLTWNCRDAKATPSQSVRFRYVEADPENTGVESANADADLPKRFYLCEMLFRHEGVLFLGQTVVPRLAPHDFSIAAAGFINDTHVSPPDPGYVGIHHSLTAQVQRAEESAPVPKPPLAERTRHYGADADEHSLMVRVSDMGLGLKLGPDDLRRPGDVFFAMFAGVSPHYPEEAVIFRFELLEVNVQRLRQDSAHWKRRTEEIAKEVLARRDWLLEQPLQRLPVAAYVLNDADLLKLIRGELREWLEKPGEKPDHHTKVPTEMRRRMESHLRVLLCLGEPTDLPLLAKLAAHKASGGNLMFYAGTIGERYGVAQAADVLLPLLRRTEPASDPHNLALLRTVEPGIPARIRADDVLIDCARLLDRSPSEFGFQLAAARLLELDAKLTLTERERNVIRTRVQNQSGCWYAPSTGARMKAVERMSKLLELVSVDSRDR